MHVIYIVVANQINDKTCTITNMNFELLIRVAANKI